MEPPRGVRKVKEDMSLKCEGAKQEDVSEDGAAEGLTAADLSSANVVRLLSPSRPRARDVGCFLLLSRTARRERAGSRARVSRKALKRGAHGGAVLRRSWDG